MNHADMMLLIMLVVSFTALVMSIWLLVRIHIQDDVIERLERENKRLRSVLDDIYRLLETGDGHIPM